MILASASQASFALALAAAAAYALPAAAASRLSERAARAALLVAWILHGTLLAAGLLGEQPRFGFAPALSVTAWLVLTVYAIESKLFPLLKARWALAGFGAAAVLLTLIFPGSPLHAAASPWLPLHWALGIASYGLFAAAVVHAWLMTRAEKQIRLAADSTSGMPLLTLERLTFRFVDSDGNSDFVLDKISTADVPLPAGGLLGALGVRSLTHMPTDFSHGPRPAPIDIPGAPRAQPLICYESLYPGFTPGGADRPGWIVNISNDAWFGRSSGPLQHLNLASYRAIETGLPVVRSTPTGVSAMIDPWGRVIGDQRLEPGESGIIDARLPRPAAVTLYGRFGDLFFWLAILTGMATAAPWSRLGDRHRRASVAD